jgi:hypothetical protein
MPPSCGNQSLELIDAQEDPCLDLFLRQADLCGRRGGNPPGAVQVAEELAQGCQFAPARDAGNGLL